MLLSCEGCGFTTAVCPPEKVVVADGESVQTASRSRTPVLLNTLAPAGGRQAGELALEAYTPKRQQRSDRSSRFKGVTYDKSKCKWKAQPPGLPRGFYGRYESEEACAKAVDEKRQQHGLPPVNAEMLAAGPGGCTASGGQPTFFR